MCVDVQASGLTVKVTGQDCMSSTCDSAFMTSCRVDATTNQLGVTSRLAWRRTNTGPCTPDCSRLEAACVSPALPTGSHVVRFGDRSMTLSIPADLGTTRCLETDIDVGN
jgi:hypothetical protein